MDRDFEITTGPDGLPTQTFNGKTYKKRINEDKEWFSEFHKRFFVKSTFDYFTAGRYNFLPWNIISLEGTGSLKFKMMPKK